MPITGQDINTMNWLQRQDNLRSVVSKQRFGGSFNWLQKQVAIRTLIEGGGSSGVTKLPSSSTLATRPQDGDWELGADGPNIQVTLDNSPDIAIFCLVQFSTNINDIIANDTNFLCNDGNVGLTDSGEDGQVWYARISWGDSNSEQISDWSDIKQVTVINPP